MITTRAVAAALGLGLGLALTAGLLAPPAGAARPAQGAASPCTAVVTKVAAPDRVPLDAWTQVTLTVRPSCPATVTVPLHLVFVLDNSDAMQGPWLAAMQRAVTETVAALDLPAHASTQVAIVKFDTVATTLCKLTNDASRLISCANKLDAKGGRAIDAGIRMGLRELTTGRDRGTTMTHREVMVVLSGGANNTGCDAVLRATGQAKAQGILVVTVCAGPDCDAACMHRAATSARYFFQAPLPDDLPPTFARMLADVTAIVLKRLVITDLIPANMRLEEGSVDPPPTKGDTASGLIWQQNHPRAEGFTVTFRLRPLELGRHPTNVRAIAELTDWRNQVREIVFPVPTITVLPPTVPLTPTPLPQPPTPMPTAVPNAIQVCPKLQRLAPDAAIAAALANPATIAGWNAPCHPGLPPGPTNPARRSLGLSVPGKPYHPLFNGLEFKCGCP